MIDRVMVASTSHTAELAKHNVPVPLTSLIGRSHELDGIVEMLRRTRLVTVTGPGGIGKTRLATEVAHRQVARRPDGVWLVDLTAGPDPAAEVARTLDVGGSSAAPTASLRRYLADRDLLLVLDNCEHVSTPAPSSATRCCRVRRPADPGDQPRIAWGERRDGLASGVARAEAGHRLFVERARQRTRVIPDAAADATIAELCERLDRLPLAIELAAARIGVRSPDEILADLEARLGALGGGSRLPRLATRRCEPPSSGATSCLTPPSSEAFRNLAVFVGGFDSGAAMAVVPGLTVDAVARLVDKSVVASGKTRVGQRATGYSKPSASTRTSCW